MSVLTYIASNYPLPEKRYPADLKVNFNLDTGVIDDGGLDDSFELIPCILHRGTSRTGDSNYQGEPLSHQ